MRKMSEIKARMMLMLFGWTSVAIIYGTTQFVGGSKWVIPELWLDQQIPFNVQGVWLYLSFFLVIPFAFWKAPFDRVKPMMLAISLSAIISGVFFILFPSTLNYPPVPDGGFSAQVFHLLLWIDTPQNCFPSLHAALTIICLLGLWEIKKLIQNLLVLTATLAILFSIIQLRRHLTLDLTAGILVGSLSYAIALIRKSRKYRQQVEI